MIRAKVKRDADGLVAGFTVENHGLSEVCAAVSMFALNTVNSIEAFADDDFVCDYNEKGGYLSFSLDEPHIISEAANVLLKSLFLGLKSASEQYPEEIVFEEGDQND